MIADSDRPNSPTLIPRFAAHVDAEYAFFVSQLPALWPEGIDAVRDFGFYQGRPLIGLRVEAVEHEIQLLIRRRVRLARVRDHVERELVPWAEIFENISVMGPRTTADHHVYP